MAARENFRHPHAPQGNDAEGKKTDVIHRDITVTGPLDDVQRARLLEIANKCPIHRTLENKPTIISALKSA